MSIFKRIGSILNSHKNTPPPKTINPFEESNVGDIVEVELEEYIVSGKAVYFDRGYAPHRFAYYLQNGRDISCLVVEKGRVYDCFLCRFLEGALDDPNEVPTTLQIDEGTTYELEQHRSDMVRTEGNTDFRGGDELQYWRYFADEERFFFLQWQDGKFVAMEGTKVPANDVKFMKSK